MCIELLTTQETELPRVAKAMLNTIAKNAYFKATEVQNSESPMPRKKTWMNVQPTLSQTWTVDKPRSAMCVQSVDVHVSCSSHSDAQLAAFFIDPRAK